MGLSAWYGVMNDSCLVRGERKIEKTVYFSILLHVAKLSSWHQVRQGFIHGHSFHHHRTSHFECKVPKCVRNVWPASQNPYPIYDQNLRFSLPYLWPDQKFDTLLMAWPLNQYPGTYKVTVNIICEGLLLLVLPSLQSSQGRGRQCPDGRRGTWLRRGFPK